MATLIDVENALTAIIAQAVYPNGIGSPSVIASAPCRIYAGWPASSSLDADLKAGITHISVFPTAKERKTARYSTAQQTVKQPVHTLTIAVAGQTITIGGTVSTPQNVACIIGAKTYNYAVQQADTLTTIATALAALIGADIASTSSVGAVITVGATGIIKAARIASAGTVAAEFRRQERTFKITVWANSPSLRDQFSAAVDAALVQLEFLTMPDGFAARIIYQSSMPIDSQQKANLYRYDIEYMVEYATTVTQSATEIILGTLNIAGANVSPAPIKTVNF